MEINKTMMNEQENRILEMYHRLERIEMEIALHKAQGTMSQDGPASVSLQDIQKAQNELLMAKAAYQVRSNITENVLIANPIINSVHSGPNPSTYEQDLIHLLKRRDEVSLSLLILSKKDQDAWGDLVRLESENMLVASDNAKWATTMLALAEEVNKCANKHTEDPKTSQEISEMDTAMKDSRRRWRYMKGIVSAAIAGSGIDWARDQKLLQIVLNEED